MLKLATSYILGLILARFLMDFGEFWLRCHLILAPFELIRGGFHHVSLQISGVSIFGVLISFLQVLGTIPPVVSGARGMELLPRKLKTARKAMKSIEKRDVFMTFSYMFYALFTCFRPF